MGGETKESGVVKWFSYQKGYGFIERKTGDDVFIHVSEDPTDGSLRDEMALSFRVEQTSKGLQAVDVEVEQMKSSSQTEHSSNAERHSLRVPQDSAPYLEQRRKIDNLALAVHKTVRFEADEGGYEPEVIPDPSIRFSSSLLDRVQSRYDDLVDARPDLTTRSFRRSVDWRLAVGLGRASVYETNMALHHIYGIPYIPGSGLKGAVRSFILLEVFYDGETDNLEDRGLADPLFCQLFGNPAESAFEDAHKGCITFFDAYPADAPTVERDIMNPHYRDYYMDAKPPTDDQDPTPIHFLTVRNTSFTFWLGDDGRGTMPDPSDSKLADATPETAQESLLEVASHWLGRTLTEHGVGAKTAAGYGFFTE